jgi:ferredoxin
MKACPQHALQPCGFSDGFSRFNTPKLFPRSGFCKPSCTACTQVCPTRAIVPVDRDDKPFVKIGTALVDTGRCIAWRGERRCLACMRACPYQAITEEGFETDDYAQSGPSIDKDLCTGCGACENACPVTSTAAIRIQVYGERRSDGGPVLSENRKKKIIRLRNERAQSDRNDEQE